MAAFAVGRLACEEAVVRGAEPAPPVEVDEPDAAVAVRLRGGRAVVALGRRIAQRRVGLECFVVAAHGPNHGRSEREHERSEHERSEQERSEWQRQLARESE